FVGGDGGGTLAPQAQVTARVIGHVLGDKVRIGKYKPKSGYRRHTGFRARLSQIEIQSIGAATAGSAAAAAPRNEPEESAPVATTRSSRRDPAPSRSARAARSASSRSFPTSVGKDYLWVLPSGIRAEGANLMSLRSTTAHAFTCRPGAAVTAVSISGARSTSP